MDLISRSDAIDAMESKNNVITEDDYHYCEDCDHIEMCRWYPLYGCEFRSRPSAERKGKWILQEDKTKKLYGWHICSECGAWIGEPTNYCSMCGASMVRGEERKMTVKEAIEILADLGIIDASDLEEARNMAIEALKQTQWIPCSERLPEVGKEVLVCFDFKGQRSVYISTFYGDGNFHGLDDEYLTVEGRKYRKAIAWMPLPEAYKEDK